jgi:hypothetical protein
MRAMVTFFVIAVVLPLVAVVGNSILRWAYRLPQSAPADLILVLIVFDISILIKPDELVTLVPYAREFYALVLFICVIMWAITIGKYERDLHAWIAAVPPKGYPFGLTFMCMGMSGLALVANLTPIAARGLI